MLNLYRRHLAACPHTLRTQKKCQCPIWVQGTLRGVWMKKSVGGVRNWEAAQKIVRNWEAGDTAEKVGVNNACDRYLADAKARGLKGETIAKYELLFGELKRELGRREVAGVTPDDLREVRERWKLGPLTTKKRIERLRAFFRFCQESGWINSNPAKVVKAPNVKPKPTMPFTDPEVEKILWATEVYPIKGYYGEGNRMRLRAFILLLLNTGLRLQDAVTIEYERFKDNRLLLYTQKTGTPVHIPLPPEVMEAIGKVPAVSTSRPFWSGSGDPRSATKDWQRSLRKLFKLAGITNGHAHRFRDTFSIRLLSKGVPLQEVSILLGHSSVSITEKSYAPWIKARQDRLESLVRATWD